MQQHQKIVEAVSIEPLLNQSLTMHDTGTRGSLYFKNTNAILIFQISWEN